MDHNRSLFRLPKKQSFSELLRTKEDKLDITDKTQLKLYHLYANESMDTDGVLTLKEQFNDYVNQDIKRRAQTIGNAYRIAIKMLLSVLNGMRDVKVNSYIKNNKEFDRSNYDIDNAIRDVIGFEELVYTFEETLDMFKKVEDFTIINDQALKIIASIAVTLSWLKAKVDTGFYPKDLNAMLTISEDHKKLTEEVATLLQRTLESFEGISTYINPTDDYEIDFDVEVENNGLVEVIDMVLTNNTAKHKVVIDIKTTSTLPKDGKHNYRNLLAFKALNKDTEYTYYYAIFYPRFNTIVRFV